MDGGLEGDKTVRFGMAAGGRGVVEGVGDALGVRHQAKNTARGIADSGDGVRRTVGKVGISGGRIAGGINILESNLVVGLEGGKNVGIARNEPPLAMRDGQVKNHAGFGNPFAEPGRGANANPAVLEFSGGVVSERGGMPIVGIDAGGGSGEKAGLDEDLESVADAQNE